MNSLSVWNYLSYLPMLNFGISMIFSLNYELTWKTQEDTKLQTLLLYVSSNSRWYVCDCEQIAFDWCISHVGCLLFAGSFMYFPTFASKIAWEGHFTDQGLAARLTGIVCASNTNTLCYPAVQIPWSLCKHPIT